MTLTSKEKYTGWLAVIPPGECSITDPSSGYELTQLGEAQVRQICTQLLEMLGQRTVGILSGGESDMVDTSILLEHILPEVTIHYDDRLNENPGMAEMPWIDEAEEAFRAVLARNYGAIIIITQPSRTDGLGSSWHISEQYPPARIPYGNGWIVAPTGEAFDLTSLDRK